MCKATVVCKRMVIGGNLQLIYENKEHEPAGSGCVRFVFERHSHRFGITQKSLNREPNMVFSSGKSANGEPNSVFSSVLSVFDRFPNRTCSTLGYRRAAQKYGPNYPVIRSVTAPSPAIATE